MKVKVTREELSKFLEKRKCDSCVNKSAYHIPEYIVLEASPLEEVKEECDVCSKDWSVMPLHTHPSHSPKQKEQRSKHWDTLVDILDGQFPKGECKERGRALVMLAYTDMMLRGFKFTEDGMPKQKEEHRGSGAGWNPPKQKKESGYAALKRVHDEKCIVETCGLMRREIEQPKMPEELDLEEPIANERILADAINQILRFHKWFHGQKKCGSGGGCGGSCKPIGGGGGC